MLMKLKVVYYMPNEEIFKKDDLSRELCLVLQGACYLMDDDKVKRVVRDDVSVMFFLLSSNSQCGQTDIRGCPGSEYGTYLRRTFFFPRNSPANDGSNAA